MIALVLAQLAARWGQAVTLLVLSMAATVAAVSVPVYVDTVDRTAVADELAAAHPFERVVSFPPVVAGPADRIPLVDSYAAVRAEFTWLEPVTTTRIRAQGLRDDAPLDESHQLIARDGFCQRVAYRAGRCPVGTREVAVPAELADVAGLEPGGELELTPVVATQFGLQQDGPPVALALVGVFEADDPADPYWRTTLDPLGAFGSPAIFTNRNALETIVHTEEVIHLDAVLPAGQLTADRVPELRRQLERAQQRFVEEDPTGGAFATGLPRLLDRISGQGDQARALLPIAAAPLLAVCWFVVYLAVGHGTAARRHEFAVVALRGARLRTRAAAVTTECLLPVLAGAPAGLLAAHLLVAAAEPAAAGPVIVDGTHVRSAVLAAAGTVAAALLALRRELSAPVVQLLRRIPPRRRAAVAAAEVLAVALAVAAVVELQGLDGELVGVMVAAPAAVMLAVAVLAARGVRPVSAVAGRWALRRGWLGPSMAALSLARRPGAARLVMVLALVLGLLGFAVTSADVAAAGRVAEAQRGLGAARVLAVEDVARGALLGAVRAADPSGRYAMAVVIASGRPEDPPVVAVDATRLARVAQWSHGYGGTGPEEVARLLRPPAPEPVLVSDGEVAAELSLGPRTTDGTASLSLLLSPPAGNQAVATFGPVTADQRTYRAEVAGCPDGCRLAGVVVSIAEAGDAFGEPAARIELVLHELRQGGAELGPPGWLTDPGRWRTPERGQAGEHPQIEVLAGGLRLTRPGAEPGAGYVALAVAVPYPLPVVTAGALPDGELVTSIDNQLIRVAPQGSLAGVPGAGATGVLMDLEYADRLATEPGAATEPLVWLTADAPVEVIDRLREQGLVISDDQTVDSVRAASDRSGAALALRFFLLAGAMAVLVGLGALALVTAVDRRTWRRALQELRAHGVAGRTTAAAALWTYGGIVVAGAAAGSLAAGAAWLATAERLPLGVDPSVLVYRPQWTAVAPAWGLVVAGLVAAAVAAAWWWRDPQEVGG